MTEQGAIEVHNGKECLFLNCFDCRECAENPSRIASSCISGGYYTTRSEQIKKFRDDGK